MVEDYPERGDWPQRIAVVGAALAAGIAAAVILGWNVGSETLIAARPNYIPLQYNTALSLLLCVVSVLATSCNRRWMARAAALVALLFAAATGLQYLLTVNLHIDDLFFRNLVHHDLPGRMAPNSVVAFLCVTSALLLLTYRERLAHATAIAASLAAFVAAVGTVAFAGYLMSIPGAYAWLPQRPIALLATVAFPALAMATLAIACRGGSGDRRQWPRWIAIPTFVLVMSVCGMIAVALWDASHAIGPDARRSLMFAIALVLVFGTGMAIALVAVIRLAQSANRRSRDLEFLNQQLDSEAARRQQFAAQLEGERQRLRDILNALPSYVILLAADYTVPFANTYFEERFGRSEGRRCYEYLFQRQSPCESCESFRVLQTGEPHRWQWAGPDGRDYDIRDFVFHDAGGPLILEVGNDITDQKRADAELKRLNRALRLVSACNQALIHARSEEDLLRQICELAVTTGGYCLAWIGFAEDDESKSVRVAAKAGVGVDYVTDGFVTWADEPRGRGPTGVAIRSGEIAGCDVLEDKSFLPWRERALEYGFRSTLVLPLLRNGRAFGALSLYSPEPLAFHGQERELLSQLVQDLTFGIETVRTRKARAAAEKALAESEERYRSLTIATAQVIWTTNPQGLVVGDMPTWRDFTGATLQALQGWGWLDSVHPEDRERTAKTWNDAVARRALYETEYRLRRSDGEYRYVWVRGVPVLNEDGSIREWVGTCTDITDRKQTEEKLRIEKADSAVQAKLAQIFATSSDDDMYCDVLEVVLETLQSPLGVFGYIDENGANVVPSMTRQVWEKCEVPEKSIVFPRSTWGEGTWCRALQERRTIYSNQTSPVPHGHVPILRHMSVPILYQGQSIGLLQVANRDCAYTHADVLTLEKIANRIAPILTARLERDKAASALLRKAAQLERSNAELQEFAFVASHDLQEPLRKITAFSERLKDRAAAQLDDVSLDYLNRMHSAATRMGALINSLLEYSRVATRAVPFDDVDLAGMMLGILVDLEQRRLESKARIIVHTLPKVRGDPTQLRQLFQNLLGNALKFHAPGVRPVVRVSAQPAGDRWNIAIADDGIGFDPAYVEKIFKPFQRLHGRNEYEGSGMGLAICRKIAQRHGAPIEVASSPGRGATFTVSLPALSGPAIPAPNAGSPLLERTEPCPNPQCESSSPKTMTMTSC